MQSRRHEIKKEREREAKKNSQGKWECTKMATEIEMVGERLTDFFFNFFLTRLTSSSGGQEERRGEGGGSVCQDERLNLKTK